jgi:hypothetical protein
MVQLGKIKKPEAESFKEKRKLYCVPNVYPIKDAMDEYKELVRKYWDDVSGQIGNLEAAGEVKKIFLEGITGNNEATIDMLAQINEHAHGIVKKRVDEGAALVSVEIEEIYGPFNDWRNCLHVIRTKEVFDKVFESYTELSNKRLQHIMNVIEKSLDKGEAGLLIMTDEDRVKLQFPADIEVFLVTPASYDSLLKWLREQLKKQ